MNAYLEDYTEKVIAQDKIEPFLQAIYDVSDEVGPDDDYRGFMGFDIGMSMLRVSYQLVKRFKNEEDRYKLLKSIFENSESVSMVVSEAAIIFSKEEGEEDNIVNPEQVKELVSLALERIREFARDGKLPKVSEFASALYRWCEWAPEEVKSYVAELVKTDEGMIDFLTGLLSMSISHSMTDRVVRKQYRVSHRGLCNLIDNEELDKIVTRARAILSNSNSLEERQRTTLEVFVE